MPVAIRTYKLARQRRYVQIDISEVGTAPEEPIYVDATFGDIQFLVMWTFERSVVAAGWARLEMLNALVTYLNTET
jgi:hypothetical protein